MCSSPRETLLQEIKKLDKKSENDYMIRPENFHKIWSKRGGPDPPPPPPPPPKKKKKKICQNSLTRELKIRFVGFVLEKL